jgi:hypothetical protein
MSIISIHRCGPESRNNTSSNCPRLVVQNKTDYKTTRCRGSGRNTAQTSACPGLSYVSSHAGLPRCNTPSPCRLRRNGSRNAENICRHRPPVKVGGTSRMDCSIAVKADQLTVSRFYLELLSRCRRAIRHVETVLRYYNHLVREKIRRGRFDSYGPLPVQDVSLAQNANGVVSKAHLNCRCNR